jgi:dipeptidyl aminopeptidase/acylaminoacyl peptidase
VPVEEPPRPLSKRRGIPMGVKTGVVIYPEEGHTISKPENVRDVRQRTSDWFKQYLN